MPGIVAIPLYINKSSLPFCPWQAAVLVGNGGLEPSTSTM